MHGLGNMRCTANSACILDLLYNLYTCVTPPGAVLRRQCNMVIMQFSGHPVAPVLSAKDCEPCSRADNLAVPCATLPACVIGLPPWFVKLQTQVVDHCHVICRWFDPGFFHAANMYGLTPSTKYFYRAGDASAVSFPAHLSCCCCCCCCCHC